MARVSIFGNLRWDCAIHSWALVVGAELARFEFLHVEFTNATEKDIETARYYTVRRINEELCSHNINYRIPENTAGGDMSVKEIMQNVLDEIRGKVGPAQVAFLLIAGADYLLRLSRSSKSTESSETMRTIARNRVEDIPYHCRDIDVNTKALFGLLAEPPYGLRAVRDKLRRIVGPHKVLFVSVGPKEPDGVRFLINKVMLGDLLRSSGELFAMRNLPSCLIQDLSPAIYEHEPTIVHFSGDGAADGLCYVRGDGTAQIVDPKALAELLSLACEKGLKGVIMNACCSEVEARHIVDGVEHVITMEGAFGSRDAMFFNRDFYSALRSGKSFEDAFTRAIARAGIDPETSALKPRLIKAESKSVVKIVGKMFLYGLLED
ncbi:hypothetical protein LTR66_001828 [Elasticomyces elasticus]|nr:hypothetical protein LTR50_006087 [Elasticomyces elasticus]KAK4999054.1 hypothetical protein LTR66_001828 [Elasticomyces elasticus]